MDDAHQLLKIPKSECPDIWIRLPRHKWPKSWSSNGRPSRSSRAKSVRSSFGRGLLWERQFEKNPSAALLGEVFQLEMLIQTP